MQTFDYEKTPIVPPYCLWVSGLLLISGCRAEAGLPRLQRAWQPVGNRPAMGEKAPGAWGAPGADPLQNLAAGLASLWAGGSSTGTHTAFLRVGAISLVNADFLLCGDVSGQILPTRENGSHPGPAADFPESGDGGERDSAGTSIASASKAPMHEMADSAAGSDQSSKAKVMFFPKPVPWNGVQPSGETFSPRPASFCRRVVTFTPTPTPRPAA